LTIFLLLEIKITVEEREREKEREREETTLFLFILPVDGNPRSVFSPADVIRFAMFLSRMAIR